MQLVCVSSIVRRLFAQAASQVSGPVPFDTFMNGSLSVSIPLTLLVPAEYRFTPADVPETYSFWMTPDSAAAFRKAKDLPGSRIRGGAGRYGCHWKAFEAKLLESK
jgi:hypothetical protein